MKCISCENLLSKVKDHLVELDVCNNGCGGIWFDGGELEKFDFQNEGISKVLLKSGKNQNRVAVDSAKIRNCPKCALQLQKVCYNKDFSIEIDSCQDCGGVWLDPGELQNLRENNSLDAERRNVFDKFCEQIEQSPSQKRIRSVIELIFN